MSAEMRQKIATWGFESPVLFVAVSVVLHTAFVGVAYWAFTINAGLGCVVVGSFWHVWTGHQIAENAILKVQSDRLDGNVGKLLEVTTLLVNKEERRATLDRKVEKLIEVTTLLARTERG